MTFNFFIALIMCTFIAGCSGGGGSNKSTSIDDRISTQIILSGINTPIYDEANYSNLRLSPDNNFLYAIENKFHSSSISITYFKYDDLTHRYVFEGNAASTSLSPYDSFELSHDGRNLYVVSGDQITILNRDGATGLLSPGLTLKNTQVSGFKKIVLDSSGLFAYVTSGLNNISIFYRDATTGELTLSATQSIDNNLLIEKMILSNDDKNIYFICSNSIHSATRDTSTGVLTFGQVFGTGVGGSDTLREFVDIADAKLVADNSLLVFANAYIDTSPTTGSSYRSLVVLQRDTASGDLSYIKSLRFGDMASLSTPDPFVRGSILVDAAHSYFYLLSEDATTAVSSSNHLIKLHGNPLDSSFSVFDTTDLDDFDYYRDLDGVIRSDGSKLLVSKKYDGGSHIVSVIPDNASVDNDTITKLKTYNNTNEGLSLVSNVLTSPDGQYVYTFTKDDNYSIAIYHLDATTGKLSYVDTRQLYSAGDPYQVFMLPLALTLSSQVILDSAVITPDGQQLLIVSEDGVVCFNRDQYTGELTNPKTSQGGVYEMWDNNGNVIPTSTRTFFDTTLPGFRPDSLTISPDGRNIYVSGVASGQTTALAIVSRNVSTGELQLIGILDTALPSGDLYPDAFNPRSPLISKITHDGKYLYLSNPSTATLIEIKLNTNTGMAESVSYIKDGMTDNAGMSYDGLSNVSAIRFSSDDRFIYLASNDVFGGATSDNVSLQVLERHPDTGELLVTQLIRRNDTNNADSALFPADAILNDGKEYLFSQDVIKDGARTIDISADGENLYMLTQNIIAPDVSIVASGYSIDVYNIDKNTGMVSLVQRYKSGISNIGASSLRSVPDSNYLIVTSDLYGGVDVLTK